jgi:hypothetical protein
MEEQVPARSALEGAGAIPTWPPHVRRIAVWVVINEFGTVLAEPDAVVDAAVLFGGERWIVTGSTRGSSRDVGGDADVDGLGGILSRAAGRFAAVEVGAAVVDPLGQNVYGSFGKVVSHGGAPASTTCAKNHLIACAGRAAMLCRGCLDARHASGSCLGLARAARRLAALKIMALSGQKCKGRCSHLVGRVRWDLQVGTLAVS